MEASCPGGVIPVSKGPSGRILDRRNAVHIVFVLIGNGLAVSVGILNAGQESAVVEQKLSALLVRNDVILCGINGHGIPETVFVLVGATVFVQIVLRTVRIQQIIRIFAAHGDRGGLDLHIKVSAPAACP